MSVLPRNMPICPIYPDMSDLSEMSDFKMILKTKIIYKNFFLAFYAYVYISYTRAHDAHILLWGGRDKTSIFVKNLKTFHKLKTFSIFPWRIF